MQIETTLIGNLDFEDLPGSIKNMAKKPKLNQLVHDIMDDINLLPDRGKALWDEFEIDGIASGNLTLKNGFDLHVDATGFAQLRTCILLVCMCTAGIGFDEKIAAYQGESITKSTVADSIGTWIVQSLRSRLIQKLTGLYHERGITLSSPIRPGDTGWPITDQAIIFQLLDGNAIGVELTGSMMMIPLKSTTFALFGWYINNK